MSKTKSKRQRNSGRTVAPREANKMYAYWTLGKDGKTRPLREVAKHFGRVRNTILSVKKRYGWEARLAEAVEVAKKETDSQVQENARTTRQSLSGVFVKMSQALLDGDYELEVNSAEDFGFIVGKMTTLGRLVSELEGAVPTEGGGVQIWNMISDGTAKTITDKELGSNLEQHSSFIKRKVSNRF